jgi:hypothetical protein
VLRKNQIIKNPQDENSCGNNPYKPLTKKEIAEELAESRICYQNGGGEDFEKALDEIGVKYGI